MASIGKHITFIGRSAQTTTRARQPKVHPGAQLAQLLGMGFGSMASSPIISVPFKFLKELSLTSVGLGLESVPFSFGWELAEWKPKIDGSRVEFGENSGDEFVEIHEEIEVEDEQGEGFGPQIELNVGIGSDPIRNLADELFHEIEDHPGDSFEKVGDIDLTEGQQTPTEPIPLAPIPENLTGEEPKKKRIKTIQGDLIYPLFGSSLA